MKLVRPRGALSDFLFERLGGPPGSLDRVPDPSDGALDGDDFHVSLYALYQLHYRGFEDVDDGWEWTPSLLQTRRELERKFEQELLRRVPYGRERLAPGDVADALQRLVDEDGSPSLSSYLEERGTPDQFREFVVHRSVYQLQEADPHTWAIPRMGGAAKAALVMIQADEYGGGRTEQMHATLFESALRAFDLETGYGAYADHVPGLTLATVNLMSLLGLNRRWLGGIVGHLAAFEMTSSDPNLRYGNALRRFGMGPEATRFYDEHVTADQTHGRIARDDLAVSFAVAEPERAGDVLFGAGALLFLEGRFAAHLLDSWNRRDSSLYRPLPVAALA